MKMYFKRLAVMAAGQMAAFLAFLPLEAQVSLYVSPAGSADGNGSIGAPYVCIEDAQAAAQNIPAAEVTIWLREGNYILEHPLVFTADDTEGERKTLCIRSYPGEQAVLTSGFPLSLQWETYKGGVMKAHVPQDMMMDMLLVNGELRPMARYPNYDSTAVRLNGVSADATDPKRVKRWKHFEGGYLHAMHGHDWGDFHYRITGKDSKGELILEGGWQNNRPSKPHPQNRMVENILEELDAPGEWYYDCGKGYLYYYPLPGEKVEQLRFETPQLKHLVEFRGSEERPVRNITPCKESSLHRLYALLWKNMSPFCVRIGVSTVAVPFCWKVRRNVILLTVISTAWEETPFSFQVITATLLSADACLNRLEPVRSAW